MKKGFIPVLITIDEKSYEGGKNGPNHPMAWYHVYDGGKSFYTAPRYTANHMLIRYSCSICRAG